MMQLCRVDLQDVTVLHVTFLARNVSEIQNSSWYLIINNSILRACYHASLSFTENLRPGPRKKARFLWPERPAGSGSLKYNKIHKFAEHVFFKDLFATAFLSSSDCYRFWTIPKGDVIGIRWTMILWLARPAQLTGRSKGDLAGHALSWMPVTARVAGPLGGLSGRCAYVPQHRYSCRSSYSTLRTYL